MEALDLILEKMKADNFPFDKACVFSGFSEPETGLRVCFGKPCKKHLGPINWFHNQWCRLQSTDPAHWHVHVLWVSYILYNLNWLDMICFLLCWSNFEIFEKTPDPGHCFIGWSTYHNHTTTSCISFGPIRSLSCMNSQTWGPCTLGKWPATWVSGHGVGVE